MTEELEKRISEAQRDKLIERINGLYNEGVIRIQDWMAIYEILLAACERDKAETYEQIIIERLNGSDAEDSAE